MESANLINDSILSFYLQNESSESGNFKFLTTQMYNGFGKSIQLTEGYFEDLDSCEAR